MHFLILSLVSDKSTAIDETASHIDQFDENLEVDEHETTCYCAESNQSQLIDAQIASDMGGTYSDFRKNFQFLPEYISIHEKIQDLNNDQTISKQDKEQQLSYCYSSQEKLWHSFFYTQYSELQLKYASSIIGEADTDCEECHGAGVYLTTSNPNGHFDYYRIGGRYDGLITLNPNKTENGFNFSPAHESLNNNFASVESILSNNILAYGILTPDEQWIERGNNESPDDWKARYTDILNTYKSYYAVALDCHS